MPPPLRRPPRPRITPPRSAAKSAATSSIPAASTNGSAPIRAPHARSAGRHSSEALALFRVCRSRPPGHGGSDLRHPPTCSQRSFLCAHCRYALQDKDVCCHNTAAAHAAMKYPRVQHLRATVGVHKPEQTRNKVASEPICTDNLQRCVFSVNFFPNFSIEYSCSSGHA